MKPPKCNICNHEHYGVDHVWDEPKTVKVVTVTKDVAKVVECNHCVTKQAEIERLRNQIKEMELKPPKRDRAAYMRRYRAGGLSEKREVQTGGRV